MFVNGKEEKVRKLLTQNVWLARGDGGCTDVSGGPRGGWLYRYWNKLLTFRAVGDRRQSRNNNGLTSKMILSFYKT